MIVLPDHIRIVHILYRHKRNGRIIVCIIIQPLCSHQKRRHGFPRMQRFPGVCDHAARNQLHYAVRNHFRMNAQVFFILQKQQHRIRDRSDAKLQCIAVTNQLCTVLTDCLFRFSNYRRGKFQNWTVDLYKAVNLGYMKLRVSVRPRHTAVYLGNHVLRLFDCRKGIIYGNAQAYISVPIRRGNLNERRVYRKHSTKQTRNLMKTAGGEISPPLFYGSFCIRTQKKCVEPEIPFHVRICKPGVSHRHKLHDLRMFKMLFLPYQLIR